ncbi:class I SAM-dependent methyltransferase [Dictyobacter arantiisoli]|uniref:Methyltransferase type 11 n=1 Tax=Dictyobacter arantiisoli TaxID=2014874 RepID=A0A5A5TGQ1_9CHLR|nr:class I SAM-dependent methyltransferase [Dictyobacter arantiisoli]GCF10398.1 methyltransferase type 11 [Dictyobacter arantiisoli]
MADLPWYVHFFGEDYIRLYAPFLPTAKSEQDTKHIVRLLGLHPGDHLLDLCCGYGRHALALARYGCIVTGQDLSPSLLQKAQDEAKKQQVHVNWIQSDMRTIPFEASFDAVISMFTSFGYFQSDEEDQKVLSQISQALKPGGLFLLETIHQPRIIRTTTPHSIVHYPDGLIVLEERHFDLLTSHNTVHISLIYPDGQRTQYIQSIRTYTLTELVRMLKTAGLELQSYYGDLDGSPLSIESRLALISRKR